MKLNPSPKVRTSIYVLGVFVNAVYGVFATSEVKIPVAIVALLAGFNAVVAIMAGANVTPEN